MKRPLRPDDHAVWSKVAATVHPLPGRAVPKAAASVGDAVPMLRDPGLPPVPKPKVRHTPARPVETIEPRRKTRIVREREPIEARVDLHGMTQDRAKTVLETFLVRAWTEGERAVLVITGKGVMGDGVLRRMTPEWLAGPVLRSIVAGVSEAHRRHGGEGALYVALKRRPRG